MLRKNKSGEREGGMEKEGGREGVREGGEGWVTAAALGGAAQGHLH